MSQPDTTQPDTTQTPVTGRQAGADPDSIPLDKIDVSDSELFETDTHWGYFERLRNEEPVHYCAESEFGPYWSVTRFDDIVYVEKHPELFSSQKRQHRDRRPRPTTSRSTAGFITMDGPRHAAHRKVVQPVLAPRNLKTLEPLIRERVVRDPRRAARRRDLRLGRHGLRRAHHR